MPKINVINSENKRNQITTFLKDDQDIVEKLFDRGYFSYTGEDLRRIYYGNYESYFNSQSEADFFMLQRLLYYTADVEQAISLMEKSGLKREKWYKKRAGTDYIHYIENESLEERLNGRYTKKTVKHPETGAVIIGPNELITEDKAREIVNAGVEEVTIRSVFTCNTRHGVCRHCYGINLATGDAVEVGEAVGTIAAQSIGEPGTQLTMRTFHTGGVASNTDITQGLPRVQEIFEARNPKGEAVITEVKGQVTAIEEDASTRTKKVFVKGETGEGEYVVPFTARMRVEVGDQVSRGAALTEGSIQPKRLLAVRDVLSVETYLLGEVQKVYRSQGVEIGDKHIEVMVRQMIRKVRVMDPGDTDLLMGTLMDINDFTDANKDVLIAGGVPATGRPVLMGITKASLETNSFLSVASFQETTRVLTDAAIRGKKDHLLGLKENVIIGKIIPAGTGMARYRNLEPQAINEAAYLVSEQEETENAPVENLPVKTYP